MTVLWIILGIIAFLILAIYILLHISVKAAVDADLNRVKIDVTYLWFKIWSLDTSKKDDNEPESQPEPDKPKPQKPEIELVEITDEPVDQPQRSSVKATDSDNFSDADKQEDEGDKPEEKEKFFDKAKRLIEEYKPYVPVAKKGLRKLFKLIRFYDLDFSVTVGDEDAYEAAMKFGKINALVYSILGLLCCAFSVKIKNTSVNCSFDSSKTDGHFKTVVKVRPSAVVALAAYLGSNYLLIKRKQKKSKVKSVNNDLEKELNNDESEEQQS